MTRFMPLNYSGAWDPEQTETDKDSMTERETYETFFCALDKRDRCEKEIIEGCDKCPNFVQKRRGR